MRPFNKAEPAACTRIIGLGVLTVLLTAESALAQDWPQWRGPNRDGVVASFREPASWPDTLARRWSIEVGLGYATPILVGDRIYMFTRQGEDEVMMALEAATGDVIWRTGYAAPFSMSPAANRHGDGPKASPTFADGRLYALGMGGVVSAFDAGTGERVWQTPPTPPGPLYGTAMSPLVDGDRVIVHVGEHGRGALTAFDRDTGDVVWTWDGDGPGYGSPIAVDFEGVRHVVTFTEEKLIGVSAEDGELLWERPYTTQSTQNTITPLVYENTLVVSGLRNGVQRITVQRQGDRWVAENVWDNREVALYMSNAVIADDVLFGMSSLNSGQYFGVDLENGRTLWTSDPRQGTNAAIVRAGDFLLILEDDAELIVVRASRTAFDPIRRYEVADSATWAEPVIAGNRMFVKDVRTLALWILN